MKTLIAACLLFATPVLAGDVSTIKSFNGPMSWTFYGPAVDGGPRMIVSVANDGTVTLGEGVTLDEASRAFWDELQRMGMQRPCSNIRSLENSSVKTDSARTQTK